MLNNFKNTHKLFFVVGLNPINIEQFNDHISRYSIVSLGTIQLIDNTPCVVLMMPSLLYILPLIKYHEINVLTHMIIEPSKSKLLRERMLPEHVKYFSNFL